MRRLLCAVAVGVGLVLVSPVGGASSAVAQDASAYDPVSERIVEINAIMDEINAASDVVSDPRFQTFGDSGDPRQMADMLESMAPEIAAVRTKLLDAKARLDALPPLQADVEGAEMLAVMASDAARSAAGFEAMLDDIQQLPQALRRNDPAAIRKAGLTLVQTGITMIDNQAIMLESRSVLVERSSSERSSVLIQAEMYKGMAAGMRASIGMVAFEDAASLLRSGAARVEGLLVKGRADLAREVSEVPLYVPSQRPMLRAIYAQQGSLFDVGDEVRTAMLNSAAIAEGDDGGGDLSDTLWTSMDVFSELETRQQDILSVMMQTSAEMMAVVGN